MLSCEKEDSFANHHSYNLGYLDAIDLVSRKILTEYMGHFPDVNIDVVLKKLRDEIIDMVK